MDKALVREFFTRLNRLGDREYFLSTVAYGVAPTLRGIKPSSLLSFSSKGRNMHRLWGKYQREIPSEFGLDFFVLKETEGYRLVLFYNPGLLEDHVSGGESREFLQKMGYANGMTLDQSLHLLKNRFERMCPHEIGVFLGIPVGDVAGFIRYKGSNCLFCSYWKVYHDPEGARALFRCYDAAKVGVICSVAQGF